MREGRGIGEMISKEEEKNRRSDDWEEEKGKREDGWEERGKGMRGREEQIEEEMEMIGKEEKEEYSIR